MPRGKGTYYRVAQFDPEILQFTGRFYDYFASGQPLLAGQYSSSGKKNGLFIRSYKNGNVYSSGSYDDDYQTGLWRYFYPDGKLKEVIDFSQPYFVVIDYFDPLGQHLVVNGTGRWKKLLPVEKGEMLYLNASFRNSKRDGTWLLQREDGSRFAKEIYEEGKLEEGILYDIYNVYYTGSQVVNDLFYPQSFIEIEGFNVWEASKEDYPYIQWLSDHPTDYVLTQIDSSVSELSKTFIVPDRAATYPGGLKAFYQAISRVLVYPVMAQKKGIAGKVYVEFIIESDGKIYDIQVLKGIGGGCDQEAVLAILAAGNWFPAQKSGLPVAQRIVLPITFQLVFPKQRFNEN